MAQIGLAQADWDDPSRNFDTRTNDRTTMSITWLPVDNVQKVCDSENKKRGFQKFGVEVQACSFWEGDKCTIITGKKTSMHSIGHEVRHCYQGNWH